MILSHGTAVCIAQRQPIRTGRGGRIQNIQGISRVAGVTVEEVLRVKDRFLRGPWYAPSRTSSRLSSLNLERVGDVQVPALAKMAIHGARAD